MEIYRSAISFGLGIIQEFGLSMFGLTGTHLYSGNHGTNDAVHTGHSKKYISHVLICPRYSKFASFKIFLPSISFF